jgi:AcrR family transcriptional regulator
MADAPKGSPRRGAILATVARLLPDMGFQAITTARIAREAGISKRDLYGAFPSKAHLLEALIEHGVQTMARSLTIAPPTTPEAFRAALETFGIDFLGAMLSPERLAIYRAAIAEAATAPALGRALLDTGAGHTIAIVTEFLATATARGLVDLPSPSATTAIYFRVLLGDLMLTALLDPVRRPDPATIQARARFAVEVITRLQGMAWTGPP